MKTRRTFPARFIERYQPIHEDFDALLDALSRPPVGKTVRINSLKATQEQALEWLSENEPEVLPWWDMALRVGRFEKLGKMLAHFLGMFYVQDASSMIPPLVLDPQPGERVLDIAAAPGSKATQMAAMMDNAGLLIANDFSRSRVRGLIGNVDRAGCLNVAICRMDGVRLGRDIAGTCDRVLVDAPCTCEGIMGKTASALDRWSVRAIDKFGRIQKGLVIGGYRALRPGGTMVYSTCTIAPEENEGVVQYLLDRFPDAEPIPIALEGFKMRRALTEWQERPYDARIANCRRILPQDNDSEAFFLARVRKPE